MIAIGQLRYDTPGRAFYDRKLAEGKTSNEAIRALKRRLSVESARRTTSALPRTSTNRPATGAVQPVALVIGARISHVDEQERSI